MLHTLGLVAATISGVSHSGGTEQSHNCSGVWCKRSITLSTVSLEIKCTISNVWQAAKPGARHLAPEHNKKTWII